MRGRLGGLLLTIGLKVRFGLHLRCHVVPQWGSLTEKALGRVPQGR
jgi:hypothetical protein